MEALERGIIGGAGRSRAGTEGEGGAGGAEVVAGPAKRVRPGIMENELFWHLNTSNLRSKVQEDKEILNRN